MSVTRIAEAIQPAWIRTAEALRVQPDTLRLTHFFGVAADVALFVLDPAALVALSLAVWRFGVDLNWTEDFFISQGLFSHWQVWLASAMALKFGHVTLRRTLQRPPAEDRAIRKAAG